MKDLIETITTGTNGKILFWFVFLIIFIYVPFLWMYLRKRKDKQRAFEHDNIDAIKAYFELDLIGTLTVYSIDDEDPVFFYNKTRSGIYLLPGEHKIGVQYYWSKKDFSLTGYENFNIPPREINVYVEKDKTYSLGYDIDIDKYKFKEIENG